MPLDGDDRNPRGPVIRKCSAGSRMGDRSIKRQPISIAADGMIGPSGDDLLAVEEPLEIRLVGPGREPISLAITMRTPGHDCELAAGFLFSEGIIRRREDICSISYCTDHGDRPSENIVLVRLADHCTVDPERFSRHVFTTSSCGICGRAALELVRALGPPALDPRLRVSREVICSLPDALRRAQMLFARTGGVHASALSDGEGKIVRVREDVGRHNAMDKLIGSLLMEGMVPAANALVVVSGRASFELVHKAWVAGIPILVAMGAPSSLAVELAADAGMTLIGFVRDRRFNIYSRPERLV